MTLWDECIRWDICNSYNTGARDVWHLLHRSTRARSGPRAKCNKCRAIFVLYSVWPGPSKVERESYNGQKLGLQSMTLPVWYVYTHGDTCIHYWICMWVHASPRPSTRTCVGVVGYRLIRRLQSQQCDKTVWLHFTYRRLGNFRR